MILRRRLLNRMASVIVENREALLNGHSEGNNPLGHNTDLTEIMKSLEELDGLISGLVPLTNEETSESVPQASIPQIDIEPAAQQAKTQDHGNNDDIFLLFRNLVAKDRMEEASRELSKTLQMPLDRMVTATRFFSRAVKTDSTLSELLHRLCTHIEDWPEGECMRALVKTFGFQAVESQLAMKALRTRAREVLKAPIVA